MYKDQLTFFGGANESGGMQIMYGRGRNALLYDFGMAHHSLWDPTAEHIIASASIGG